MLGFPTDKGNIDNRAGFLALTLRDTLADVVTVKTWLDSKQDADLTGLGYSSGEVTTLRAAFTDMAKLASIARGQEVQAAASDFFWNAKHLTGLS